MRLLHRGCCGVAPGTAMGTCTRSYVAIGGRKSPLGGTARTPGKQPRVKLLPGQNVPQRIPGTTKVEYTNKKGRTFVFAIPVAALTHPPRLRPAASPTGWHDIDTSYCDLGDLEQDMPSPIDDCLHRCIVQTNATGEVTVRMTHVQLRELQQALVSFCKDYVLMDTRGMKTSLTYSEVNNGPDYEMYDRKLMRRRYWLAIRHRYEDVKELLWPSSLLLAPPRGAGPMARDKLNPEDDDSEDAMPPVLSAQDMLEALTWLDAASVFCVRHHQPYDLVGKEEFRPICLQREVRVLACRVRSEIHDAEGQTGLSDVGRASGEGRSPAVAAPRTVFHSADAYITCVALATNHGVPFREFFPEACISDTPTSHASSGATGGTHEGASNNSLALDVLASDVASAHCILTRAPTLHTVRDALRMMRLLEGMQSTSPYRFSDQRSGVVTCQAVLRGLAALCAPHLFAAQDALENVDEQDLCVAMRFAASVREANAEFFASKLPPAPTSATGQDDLCHNRAALEHFAQLTLARCRQLLYRPTGVPPAVMSDEDAAPMPLVEQQQYAERGHPQALIHYNIGLRHAQGLRLAPLQATSSAMLVELAARLERTNTQDGFSVLLTDLAHNAAHHVATRAARLSLRDLTRMLNALAEMHMQNTEQAVHERYKDVFTATDGVIGAQASLAHDAAEVVALLEALAACHHTPASYTQLEMVLLRFCLGNAPDLRLLTRALLAMLRLVGPAGVSPVLQQTAATAAVQALLPDDTDKTHDATATRATPGDVRTRNSEDGCVTVVGAALDLLSALHYCHYDTLNELLAHLHQRHAFAAALQWRPRWRCATGVLLAHLAANVPSGEHCRSSSCWSEKLCREAAGLLINGLRATHDGELGPNKQSVLIDYLTTAAALELHDAREPLQRLLNTCDKTAGKHICCTGHMCLSVLESLTALNLQAPRLRAVYQQHVHSLLEHMYKTQTSSAAKTISSGQNATLAEADADVALRALTLTAILPANVLETAAAVIHTETMRLDGANSNHATTAQLLGKRATHSFEQHALLQQKLMAWTRERLQMYCDALLQYRKMSADSEAVKQREPSVST